MFSEILVNLNWIDILMGCIFVRCVFIGATNGLVIELFKLLGMLFASFTTLHYYVRFARFLHQTLAVHAVVNILLSYVLLWLFVVLIFKIFRDGWMIVLKTEAHASINKWGGFFFGLIRGVLVCGLTFQLLFVSDNKYLMKNAKTSMSGFYLMDLSPGIYGGFFDNFISKIFPQEGKNEEVFKLKFKKDSD